jgi:arylsulfatase A
MSDNGADQSTNFTSSVYGHDQNSITFKGKHYSLRDGKNKQFEGGHRLPFIWRFPKMFPPQVNENSIVSYVDVYRTLADVIGYTPKCNEGPDSRSLVSVLKGNAHFNGENKGGLRIKTEYVCVEKNCKLFLKFLKL